jgi:hypothetical protein
LFEMMVCCRSGGTWGRPVSAEAGDVLSGGRSSGVAGIWLERLSVISRQPITAPGKVNTSLSGGRHRRLVGWRCHRVRAGAPDERPQKEKEKR